MSRLATPHAVHPWSQRLGHLVPLAASAGAASLAVYCGFPSLALAVLAIGVAGNLAGWWAARAETRRLRSNLIDSLSSWAERPARQELRVALGLTDADWLKFGPSLRLLRGEDPPPPGLMSPYHSEPGTIRRGHNPSLMTRSGMFEPPMAPHVATFDPNASADYSTADMVNRLEPGTLDWIDSSAAEQSFLGFSLAKLRSMSFLDIVDPEDRGLAAEQLRMALLKGEAHGLVYRIRTADGERKAIEVNVGVRYGPGMVATHLRCHLTDVTAKLRATRELRRRTRELTLVNQQLRKANRELEDLRDRYRDLYQNAPAMYFSLDANGRFTEVNDTLVRALGYPREELVGRPYSMLLTAERRNGFASQMTAFVKTGTVEVESNWRCADGRSLDVWVSGSAVLAADGSFDHSRSVAQDITALRTLEAQLQVKNTKLGRTNEELSRKNRELDEFTYVVSHDLQEPIRTLIAFSDFLLRDYGEQLHEEGREYVHYLVDASRRMRSLIQDLLNLSRAGLVTGEFGPIDLDSLIDEARADLGELIRSKGAELRVRGPLPSIWGDRERVGQLLRNLLSNGLKYNRDPAPWVEISAGPDDPAGLAVLAIRDNGIGIEPQFHAKIFQLFRRLHNRDDYEGTGAGLAICVKIAQAHGGQVRVESEPGKGSTFFVSLPRPPTMTQKTTALMTITTPTPGTNSP
ncbi:PAS domain S-box protein [Isosphaeraceae bacterium EP7]